MDKKTCTDCSTEKHISDFYYCSNSLRYKAKCKVCYNLVSKKSWMRSEGGLKDAMYKRIYGISYADYQILRESQDYKCAICGINEEDCAKNMCVDHNHSTGKVRELLCGACNKALGLAKENTDTLKSMIRYLKKHNK